MYLILKFSRKSDRLILPLAVQPVAMVSAFWHAGSVLRFSVLGCVGSKIDFWLAQGIP
jgi:hypothetical protein